MVRSEEPTKGIFQMWRYNGPLGLSLELIFVCLIAPGPFVGIIMLLSQRTMDHMGMSFMITKCRALPDTENISLNVESNKTVR